MPRFRFTRLLLPVLPAVTSVALLAGCGGGSSTSAAKTTTTTATTVPGTASRTAYTNCLTSHGLPAGFRGGFGGGGGGLGGSGTGGGASTGATDGTPPSSVAPRTLPPGVTQAQVQSALAACRSLAPAGGLGANNPRTAAYRNCLTINGVTLPSTGTGALNRNDPAVAAALTKCAALRPTRPAGTGTGTGTGESTTTPATAAP